LAAPAPSEGTVSFDRYRIILERKPFGAPPPPESPRPISPAESFARNLRLSALLEVEGGGIKVGLVDKKTGKSFFLTEGETVEGIELVSASFDDEEAVLRKGNEMAVIKLESGEIRPLSPEEQRQRLIRTRRMSYRERRRQREERRSKPPPRPKYTGEELERHLREYQMECIRQGLPPLPIPLTPEMDAQLVAEGVLPPLEPEQ
ncbi:MAG: hypothetical protein DRP22_03000, partial [Verrucomicrobia bacterium]